MQRCSDIEVVSHVSASLIESFTEPYICLLNRSLSLFVETASKPSESLKYLVPFLST